MVEANEVSPPEGPPPPPTPPPPPAPPPPIAVAPVAAPPPAATIVVSTTRNEREIELETAVDRERAARIAAERKAAEELDAHERCALWTHRPKSQVGTSAVERLRPGWAGATLTGRYNGKRAAAKRPMRFALLRLGGRRTPKNSTRPC